MPTNEDSDFLARARLSAIGEELTKLHDCAAASAAGRAPLPWPLPEMFVRLAAAVEICGEIIEDHALANARVTDDTLHEVAETLRLSREVITGLAPIALASAATPH